MPGSSPAKLILRTVPNNKAGSSLYQLPREKCYQLTTECTKLLILLFQHSRWTSFRLVEVSSVHSGT